MVALERVGVPDEADERGGILQALRRRARVASGQFL